ncbi:MAG: helix-turn-helix domain-containing protein, partial [Gammaproteobacteria bacterium]|nr:helix-turn-helix domain-containing protein [Gammaproteobacteria bacterium]
AYAESANPDLLPELQMHLGEHIEALCALAGGARRLDLGFVRAHAERRAEQHFPLDAVLLTYRAMLRAFLPPLRDAALAVAAKTAQVPRVVAAVTDLLAEYGDAAGATLTATYVEHTRHLSETEGDRRSELLNLLLSGYDESDREAALLLRRAGYLEQRQAYCVAVAQSVNPREMTSAPRAQRVVDAIGVALEGMSLRVISGVRDHLAVAVISGTRRASGWTAPQSRLAERVLPALLTLGPAVLVGISADHPSTSHIRRARHEAEIALGLANVTERVVAFAALPIRRLLIELGGEQVKPALPGWAGAFTAADAKARGRLAETLCACAAADMNVLKAARSLGLHPNTIYARLARIEAITGLDARRFDALNELLLAIELSN